MADDDFRECADNGERYRWFLPDMLYCDDGKIQGWARLDDEAPDYLAITRDIARGS